MKRIILSLLIISLLSIQPAYSYWIWTPKSGKWVNPKSLPKDNPKEQFAYFKFSSSDLKNRAEIILNTINSLRDKDSYQLDTADNLIGGVFVKSGDGRLEIDFTINTILEQSDKLVGEVLSSWLGKEN